MTLPSFGGNAEIPRWDLVTPLVRLGEKTWDSPDWTPWVRYILTIIVIVIVVVGIPAWLACTTLALH
jgi:hypothetical protein